jgi:DNA-binding NarL/FixJ family response regulator
MKYGFKHHEIAEQLNLSVSTTQNHMREVLRSLRAYLAHANLIISFLIFISSFSFQF